MSATPIDRRLLAWAQSAAWPSRAVRVVATPHSAGFSTGNEARVARLFPEHLAQDAAEPITQGDMTC